MELVDGEDLSQQMARGAMPLPGQPMTSTLPGKPAQIEPVAIEPNPAR